MVTYARTVVLAGVSVPDDTVNVPVAFTLDEKKGRSMLTETVAGAAAETVPDEFDSLIQDAAVASVYGIGSVLLVRMVSVCSESLAYCPSSATNVMLAGSTLIEAGGVSSR